MRIRVVNDRDLLSPDKRYLPLNVKDGLNVVLEMFWDVREGDLFHVLMGRPSLEMFGITCNPVLNVNFDNPTTTKVFKRTRKPKENG